MTCENCIHLPVCVLRIHWGYGSDWNNRYTPDVEKRCKSFKNKADVVEVRCKDCEYGEADYGVNGDIVIPFQYRCNYEDTWNRPDHYCGYGKRRC